LHHVVLEKWSRGRSGLHRRDPRAKLLALLVLLIALATAGRAVPSLTAMLLAILLAALIWGRLPILDVLTRACVVLPFTVPFVLISVFIGDSDRATSLLLKSYISALAVVLLVATTPIAMLLRGLESAGVPRFLLMVAQFLYRYLFVIAEEAQHMRTAAASRGGPARGAGFRAAAGAIGALFARSYNRAEDIHRAMLARGFTGRLPTLGSLRFTLADAIFTVAASAAVALARFAAERWAA
jgi:cobalt/nickel transport system permease protein